MIIFRSFANPCQSNFSSKSSSSLLYQIVIWSLVISSSQCLGAFNITCKVKHSGILIYDTCFLYSAHCVRLFPKNNKNDTELCECDHGFMYSHDKQTCVKPRNYAYGESCSTSKECQYFDDHLVCSDTNPPVCVCQDQYAFAFRKCISCYSINSKGCPLKKSQRTFIVSQSSYQRDYQVPLKTLLWITLLILFGVLVKRQISIWLQKANEQNRRRALGQLTRSANSDNQQACTINLPDEVNPTNSFNCRADNYLSTNRPLTTPNGFISNVPIEEDRPPPYEEAVKGTPCY